MKYNRNIVAASAGFVAMVVVGYVHAVAAAPSIGPAHAGVQVAANAATPRA